MASYTQSTSTYSADWMKEFRRTGEVPESVLEKYKAEGWMPYTEGGPNPWAPNAEYQLRLGKTPASGYSTNAVVNPDGSVGESKTVRNSGSLLKEGLLKAAPIVLSVAAPGLGSAIGAGLGAGTGLAGSVVGGAVIGGGTAALSGGNILKGAAMGGLGGGASYGLGGVSEVPTGGGSSPYSLGNAQLGDITTPGYLGSANFGNATGLGGTGAGLSASTDIFNGIGGGMALGSGSALSPSVQLGTPNYSLTTADPITTPSGEGLSTGPVNGGTGSGLSATPGQGLTLADPGAATGLLGGPPPQSIIDQARAAGKTVQDWMKDNPLQAKALMSAGGALLNTVGGSSSGGSSYKDDGYRPTISRGGFQASIPATGAAPGGSGMAPGGFGSGISLPTTGQANDGLWRYAGNRSQGGFMPSLASPRPQASLISPPYTAPQTGLISPPAVSNYDPRPTGPLPTNVPPMQYGYDDPVRNRQNLTPAQQRLLQNATGLLGTPAPRGFF